MPKIATRDRMDFELNFVKRFDHIACVYRDRCAVEVADGRRLTYGELKQQSLSVARLVACETRPSAVIGLHLQKAPELLAAIIGAWRAGRAWVPISPRLPVAQQEFIVADSQPELVLTDEPQSEEFRNTAPDARQWVSLALSLIHISEPTRPY